MAALCPCPRVLLTLTATLALVGTGLAGEIHYLARKGEFDKFKALLAEKPELKSERDGEQQTPLHVAAHYGHVEIVKLLLERGVEVDARAYRSRLTPLHLTESPEIVKLLIAHKADVNAESAGGTALQRTAERLRRSDKAAARDFQAIAKALLDAGARCDLLSATYLGDLDRVKAALRDDPKAALNKDAMREAARDGRAAIVQLLLEHKADPNDADFGGLPVAYFALDHPDVLRLLIKAGADVKSPLKHEPRPGTGWTGPGPPQGTLLHHAALSGRAEAVRLLLAEGVEVDARDPNGGTPLRYAAYRGRPEVVTLLLKHKASTKGKDGVTAIDAAARGIHHAEQRAEEVDRYKAVIALLSGEGVPVELPTAIALGDLDRVKALLKEKPTRAAANGPDGRPLLHRAIALDHRAIAVALLDAGAPIEGKDDGGYTALHWAAFWGREEIAKLLIARRADVKARAKSDFTPLHEAARCGRPAVARILLTAGADVNAKDDKGLTPLAWIREKEETTAELTKLFKMYGGR